VRAAKLPLDPRRAHGAFVEEEDGARVATLLLTNRECPWRCVMCDLWKATLDETVPEGAIAGQVRAALADLPQAERLKLYNAGSWFDPRAIPEAEDAAVAALVRGFARVTVESHPALIGARCLRLRDLLDGSELEVAMGLETVHPGVLPRLEKRMTLDDFARAAGLLAREGIRVRAFVLVGTPLLPRGEALGWAKRSTAWAFEAGVSAVSLVPLRGGSPSETPTLADLEEAAAFGLSLGRGKTFADVWDLDLLRDCGACFEVRRERLRRGNARQVLAPRAVCEACGG
jgi:hypothetical protein